MKRVITLCILSCLAVVTQAHEGAQGVIKDRMDRFKENKESIKAIKANLGGDASALTNGFKALGKTCKDCHNDYKE